MATIGNDIQKAKQHLDQGELVAIPTETVYGLAGNALQEKSVLQIFKAKNRPHFDPLIVHIPRVEDVMKYAAEFPDKAKKLAAAFWPGPLTLVLKKKVVIPDLVTSGMDSVAIRIPRHPVTLKLLQTLDYPLTAPSANPFGYISPTSAQHVNDQLGEKVAYILDGGPCHIGLESTIVSFTHDAPVILRKGGLSKEDIEACIGPIEENDHSSSKPQAPGMLQSHYAPSKKIILYRSDEELKNIEHPEKTGVICFQQAPTHLPEEHIKVLSASGSLDEAARNLFSYLRYMDMLEIDLILVEQVPNHGIGRAINDRLKRATAKK